MNATVRSDLERAATKVADLAEGCWSSAWSELVDELQRSAGQKVMLRAGDVARVRGRLLAVGMSWSPSCFVPADLLAVELEQPSGAPQCRPPWRGRRRRWRRGGPLRPASSRAHLGPAPATRAPSSPAPGTGLPSWTVFIPAGGGRTGVTWGAFVWLTGSAMSVVVAPPGDAPPSARRTMAALARQLLLLPAQPLDHPTDDRPEPHAVWTVGYPPSASSRAPLGT